MALFTLNLYNKIKWKCSHFSFGHTQNFHGHTISLTDFLLVAFPNNRIWPMSLIATFTLCLQGVLPQRSTCPRMRGAVGRPDPNTFTPVPGALSPPLWSFGSHYFPLVPDNEAVCSSETLWRIRSATVPPSLCQRTCCSTSPGTFKDRASLCWKWAEKTRKLETNLICCFDLMQKLQLM